MYRSVIQTFSSCLFAPLKAQFVSGHFCWRFSCFFIISCCCISACCFSACCMSCCCTSWLLFTWLSTSVFICDMICVSICWVFTLLELFPCSNPDVFCPCFPLWLFTWEAYSIIEGAEEVKDQWKIILEMSCLWKNIEGRGNSVWSHARFVCASSQSDTSQPWKDTKNNNTWGQQSNVSMINLYLCPLTSRPSLLLTALSTFSSLIETVIREFSKSLILSGHSRLWMEKVNRSILW